MKKSGWLVVALIALVVLGVVTSIAVNVYFKDKLVQGITVQMEDEGGKPISANLIINELTDEGPKKIWSGSGPGIVATSLILPKEEVNTFEINGEKIRVYRSINLEVIAYTEGKMGVAIFSVDPARPEHKSVKIVLRDVPKTKSEPTPGVWTTYEFTPVLKFATWDDIFAKYGYPRGAKIRIESKTRPYGSPTWVSGYTEVTLDSGLFSPYLSGKNKYTVYFQIKYVYAITELEMGEEKIYYERVYAVDTNTDPVAGYRDYVSWHGNLPANYDEYYITPAGDTREIAITGGHDYAFSVSVGFSYPAGITVALGVTKVPSPPATLSVTSTRSDGWVKTAGFNGFIESYSHWI